MITADTITDEQIVALRNSVAPVANPRPRSERTAFDLSVIDACDYALTDPAIGHVQRYAARARCAELLNRRCCERDHNFDGNCDRHRARSAS